MTEEQDLTLQDPLDTNLQTILTNIMSEQDPNKTKDLVDLFNWNISKKNVARIHKLNNLYDAITDQMELRVKTRADQFSHSDLLDYVKTIQGAIDTNSKNLTQVKEAPLIVQQTNNTININSEPEFDSEAKKRILAAVQATLSQINKPTQESTIVYEDAITEEIKEGNQ